MGAQPSKSRPYLLLSADTSLCPCPSGHSCSPRAALIPEAFCCGGRCINSQEKLRSCWKSEKATACSLLPGDSYTGLFLEASFPNAISREKSYSGNVKCIWGFLSNSRRKDCDIMCVHQSCLLSSGPLEPGMDAPPAHRCLNMSIPLSASVGSGEQSTRSRTAQSHPFLLSLRRSNIQQTHQFLSLFHTSPKHHWQDFCRCSGGCQDHTLPDLKHHCPEDPRKASVLWHLPWRGQEQHLQCWSRWGLSSEPHRHSCPVTKGRESHCWAQTHTLSPFRPLWEHIWGEVVTNPSHTGENKHSESHGACLTSQHPPPGGPGLVTLPLNPLHCLHTRARHSRAVESWSRSGSLGQDTCSRIATVVPIVSLIKGRRDSEHRDWNTSLKSRGPGLAVESLGKHAHRNGGANTRAEAR